MAYSLDGMGRKAPGIMDPETEARKQALDAVFAGAGDVGDEAGYTPPPSPEVPSHLIPTPDWAREGFQKTPGAAVPRGGMGAGMGLGLSRFLQTLNSNENIGATDRYGSSPLFESVTQPAAPTPPDPIADLKETLASRRTGGASPFRRRALDTLLA